MEAYWSYLEDRFPSFFFGSTFRIMCPISSKFMIKSFWTFDFQLRTLLTKVHTIIDSTFSNSLHSTISGFDLHSNELIDMHLGLILWQFFIDLPNLGLGPICYAELFWGQGLPLRIFSSSPLSWSIEQCIVGTSQLEVADHVIFPRENRARVVARSYFTLGRSCPFSRILPQVQRGPRLRNCRPTKMGSLVVDRAVVM